MVEKLIFEQGKISLNQSGEWEVCACACACVWLCALVHIKGDTLGGITGLEFGKTRTNGPTAPDQKP